MKPARMTFLAIGAVALLFLVIPAEANGAAGSVELTFSLSNGVALGQQAYAAAINEGGLNTHYGVTGASTAGYTLALGSLGFNISHWMSVLNNQDILSHFKCYPAAGDGSPGAEIGLQDQFGEFDAQVRERARFCAPVKKNDEEVPDENQHLAFYQLESAFMDFPAGVMVSNQFGEQELELSGLQSLAVPTAKFAETGEYPLAENLDHFTCYRVEGEAPGEVVDLADQLHEDPEVRVGEPTLLCNPTAKRHGAEQVEIQHPEAHLVCYRLGETFSIGLANQFEEDRLILGSDKQLCVPSQKHGQQSCQCGSWSDANGNGTPDVIVGNSVVDLGGSVSVSNDELPLTVNPNYHCQGPDDCLPAYELRIDGTLVSTSEDVQLTGAHLAGPGAYDIVLLPHCDGVICPSRFPFTLVIASRTAEICVAKFNDQNGDGIRQRSELLLSDWQITVEDAGGNVVETVTTVAEGARCVQVDPGQYVVSETSQQGWTATTDSAQTVTVAAGETVQVRFGNTEVPAFPDLELRKLAEPENFRPGMEARYILEITNVGGEATSSSIEVTDPLPSGVSFQSVESSGWSCLSFMGPLMCQHPGPINPGQTLDLILVVEVSHSAHGPFENCARVETEGDQNSENNEACVNGSTNGGNGPGASASLRTNKGCLEQGQQAVYEVGEDIQISFRVDGPNQAYARLTNTMPDGRTQVLLERTIPGNRRIDLGGTVEQPSGERTLNLIAWQSERAAQQGDNPIARAQCSFRVGDGGRPASASLRTNKGCLEQGQQAVYEVGEDIQISFRVDGPNQAYARLTNTMPDGRTQVLLERTIPGNRRIDLGGTVEQPSGERTLRLTAWQSEEAARQGDAPIAEARCGFRVEAAR